METIDICENNTYPQETQEVIGKYICRIIGVSYAGEDPAVIVERQKPVDFMISKPA